MIKTRDNQDGKSTLNIINEKLERKKGVGVIVANELVFYMAHTKIKCPSCLTCGPQAYIP